MWILLLFPVISIACHPLCVWTCDSPVCNATCTPVCQPANCSTVCVTGSCNAPNCEIICPEDMCESDSCPTCSAQCQQLSGCSLNADCSIQCQPVDCAWKCEKPTDCPSPICELNCEHPACEFSSGFLTSPGIFVIFVFLIYGLF